VTTDLTPNDLRLLRRAGRNLDALTAYIRNEDRFTATMNRDFRVTAEDRAAAILARYDAATPDRVNAVYNKLDEINAALGVPAEERIFAK
jgi:hypothetical protein